MFFLNISRSLFLEALLYYIVIIHSILPSTCLLSNPVLKFFSPFTLLFDFLGIKVVVNTVQRSSPHWCGQESWCTAFNEVVAAFSLDISVFLSLPCIFEVYLRRWSFLEGCLEQDETHSIDICQIRGGWPSRTNTLRYLSALLSITGPFPMPPSPQTHYY